MKTISLKILLPVSWISPSLLQIPLLPCNTMAQINQELGREQLCPPLPILVILCPISARQKTIAKYQWVITDTRSDRRGVLHFEPNKFRTYRQNHVLDFHPSFIFTLCSPCLQGSLAAIRFAISTPLVPLPIRLIKIKAYEGEEWQRRPKRTKQTSKSTLWHFCSLSRS